MDRAEGVPRGARSEWVEETEQDEVVEKARGGNTRKCMKKCGSGIIIRGKRDKEGGKQG